MGKISHFNVKISLFKSPNSINVTEFQFLAASDIYPSGFGGIYPQRSQLMTPDAATIDGKMLTIDADLEGRPVPKYYTHRRFQPRVLVKPGYQPSTRMLTWTAFCLELEPTIGGIKAQACHYISDTAQSLYTG